MSSKKIKVVAFDVFGTVVDWHGSIAREVSELGLSVDPLAFATKWREGYQPAMQRVRSGELGWTRIDDLHRMILDDLLVEYGLQDMTEEDRCHLNKVWHRLRPWSDVVEGLTKIKQAYVIATLSNGNIGLLTNMAKSGGLPWDCILSAEVFRKYKPDPDTYLGVSRVFDLDPEETLLAAAHQDDLDAAKKTGMKTAYVERIFEFGRDNPKDVSNNETNDYHARDFLDLARQLLA